MDEIPKKEEVGEIPDNVERCPQCSCVLVQHVRAGGKRCAQCGHQWDQPRVEILAPEDHAREHKEAMEKLRADRETAYRLAEEHEREYEIGQSMAADYEKAEQTKWEANWAEDERKAEVIVRRRKREEREEAEHRMAGLGPVSDAPVERSAPRLKFMKGEGVGREIGQFLKKPKVQRSLGVKNHKEACELWVRLVPWSDGTPMNAESLMTSAAKLPGKREQEEARTKKSRQ